MISGSHVIVYSRDAEADRAFFRDVLRLPSVDAGGGWLIFALPPAEVAVHPGEKNDVHELYLTCDDVRATMEKLMARGILCAEPTQEAWGLRTAIPLPGGGRIGLYQPQHPTAMGSSCAECRNSASTPIGPWPAPGSSRPRPSRWPR
jgi:catechol 2,3-dioxygenase-like lactoylglutathione lyase family enzyme